MTRRSTKRPPRLEVVSTERVRRPPRVPGPRSRLVRAKVAGRHDRLGRTELLSVARRLIAGERSALLGLDRFPDLTPAEVGAVLHSVWGWDDSEPSVTIDADHVLAAFDAARGRVVDVARRGGRVAFATSRPASLLGCHAALARLAAAAGATVLDPGQAGPFAAAGRARARLWWIEGVAVVTDGEGLLADAGLEAGPEMLFEVPRPDLVVADRGFAGAAVASGIEVVALADLDAMALAVAAARGLPVTVVPLHERRPAAAYSVLTERLGVTPGAPPAPPAP